MKKTLPNGTVVSVIFEIENHRNSLIQFLTHLRCYKTVFARFNKN